MNNGWATGDALFEPPSPPPRPRETTCPRCGSHLLHYEPPKGRPPCTDCENAMTDRPTTPSAILAAARTPRTVTPCPTCGEARRPCPCAGREAVRVLCADLTDDALRAEIERCEWHADSTHPDASEWRRARGAIENERDRRMYDRAQETQR